MSHELIDRLRIRAEIRRQIPTRKSVQNNEPDRIADLLEEAARVLDLYVNNNINRLEVIDETGRVYVNNNINDCKLSYQDNRRTLKIFIKNTKKNISIEDYVDD